MKGLKDKVFLVTGGGSGLGATTVLRLLNEGAKVVAAGTQAEGLAATCTAAGKAAENLLTVEFDLRDEASIIALVAKTHEQFGRLDGVANVAGAVGLKVTERDRGVDTLDAALWAGITQINLIGPGMVIRESLPLLVAAGGGSIVNVSAAGAWMGAGRDTAYSSSKIGLHALTRHTARSWGKKKVRCNVVAPGLVLTEQAFRAVTEEGRDALLEQTALSRLGQPDDLASALVFLLSDESAWITGQILSVDGGLTMRE